MPSFVQTADAQTGWDDWGWIDDESYTECGWYTNCDSYDDCPYWVSGCDDGCDWYNSCDSGDEAGEVLPPNNNYSINYSTEYLIHKGRTNKIFIKKYDVKVNGDLS